MDVFAGDCGMGPNMFLRPLDVKLNGMGTPARVTDLLKSVCSIDVPPSLLKATEVRHVKVNGCACCAAVRQADPMRICPPKPDLQSVSENMPRISALDVSLLEYQAEGLSPARWPIQNAQKAILLWLFYNTVGLSGYVKLNARRCHHSTSYFGLSAAETRGYMDVGTFYD